MSCKWQLVSVWRRKKLKETAANRMWYLVREDIEAELRIVLTRKGQAGPSCVVGFHCDAREGAPRLGSEYIDQEFVREGSLIAIRIMPKCVRVPPRMRSTPSAPPIPSDLSEDQRLLLLQTERARPRFPEELVGEDPRKQERFKNYVCKNCSCVGHWQRQCPWLME